MNDKPVLIAREGQLSGERWTLEHHELVIGRGGDCDVVLPERQVSRYHAKIASEEGKYLVYDLDSKNGTHLNGIQVVGSAPLNDGDEIQIALAVKLLFVGSDATVPLTIDTPEHHGNLELDKGQRTVVLANPEHDAAREELLWVQGDAGGRLLLGVGADAKFEWNLGQRLRITAGPSNHRRNQAIRMR